MDEAEAASQADSKKVPKEQLDGCLIVAASFLYRINKKIRRLSSQ